MKIYSGLAVLALLVSTSPQAMAASATAEEATRLVEALQTYLGKEPGVVNVTPAGETYDVKIDLAPLIAKLAIPDLSAEVSPFEMKLADQGGGKWLVTQDSPLSFSAKMPGKLDMAIKIGALKGSSVFDQNLQAFISSTVDVTDLSADETITSPEAGSTHVTYTTKSMRYETTATASGTDSLDSTARATVSGFIEKFSLPPTPASPKPVDFNIVIDKYSTDTSFKGFKNKAFNNLIAWFVAHPSKDAMKSSQADLKSIMSASLPLFDSISGTGKLEYIVATTPIGPVGLGNVGFAVDMNGVVADGALHESITAEGLTLPAGLVPAWAVGLVPDKFALDFKVADFDLAAPAKILIDNLDLANKDPIKPELQAQLLSAFLPKGAVTLSMGPSNITGKLLDVGFEGVMTAGPVGNPVGEATIKATGIDKVMEAIKSAPPEIGMQAVAGLVAAKGMAKTEADGSLSWKIENTISGTVLINGIDVSKMGGGG